MHLFVQPHYTHVDAILSGVPPFRVSNWKHSPLAIRNCRADIRSRCRSITIHVPTMAKNVTPFRLGNEELKLTKSVCCDSSWDGEEKGNG